MGRVRSSIPRSRVPLHRLLRTQPALLRRWLVVAALAGLSGQAVAASVDAARRAERSWGATRPVLVTAGPVARGGTLTGQVREVAWPVALVPDGALADLPPEARAAARLGRGVPLTAEVLATTEPDGGRARVAVPAGPAALPVVDGDVVDVWSTAAGGFTASGTPGRARTDRVARSAVVVDVVADGQVVVVAVRPQEAEAVARAVGSATVVLTGAAPP